jgi:hypothetical protein
MKSGWPVKQVSTNQLFVLGPLVGVPLFSEDTTYAVLFREITSINYQNVI